MTGSVVLPPGVSLELYDALPKNTFYFDGEGQAGNWANAANWWKGTAPAQSSTVVVPVNATLNGSFTAYSVMFLGTETVTINGVLTTMDTNPCESFMVCDDAVAVCAPGSAVNAAGALIVGNDDAGTLIANGTGSNRATLTSLNGKIGRLDGGTGNVTLNDAVWNVTTALHIGELGVGTLTISNGSVVTVGTDVGVGLFAGATGQLALTNHGTLNAAGSLVLGSGPASANGSGSGTVTVDATSQINVTGDVVIEPNEIISLAGGTLTTGPASPVFAIVQGGTLSGHGTISSLGCGVTDEGTIAASGGTLVLDGALKGTGVLSIGAASTADIAGPSIGHIAIEFTGQDSTLALSAGIADGAMISDFAAGDRVVIAGVNQMSWNGTTDILTLKDSGHAAGALHFAGSFQGDPFSMSQIAAGAVISIGNGQ